MLLMKHTLVKQIADKISEKRSTKTGVFYCEKEKNTYENFVRIKNELGNVKINTYNDSFENVILRPDISKYYNKFPTLFLVDPFGYSFDIEKLAVMMKGFGNEVKPILPCCCIRNFRGTQRNTLS